jgi:hypothetical protein
MFLYPKKNNKSKPVDTSLSVKIKIAYACIYIYIKQPSNCESLPELGKEEMKSYCELICICMCLASKMQTRHKKGSHTAFQETE